MEFKVKTKLLVEMSSNLKLTEREAHHVEKVLSDTNRKSGFVEIDSSFLEPLSLSYLLKNSPNLANKKKSLLVHELMGIDDIVTESVSDIWETKITKIVNIVECFSRLGIKKENMDKKCNGVYYPVIARPKYVDNGYGFDYVDVSIKVSFAGAYYNLGFQIYKEDLLNEYGKLEKITLRELFSRYGAREQTCSITEFEDKLQRTRSLELTNSHMRSSGMTNQHREFKDHEVITESKLEFEEGDVNDPKHYKPLPIIRVFSFLLKEYLLVHTESLVAYDYETEAVNRLFLPKKITGFLKKVFSTPIDLLVGDVLNKKHGGMIILGSGKPGVGKTLTAEVYSEMQKMPLYSVSISELGVSAKELEGNLEVIFRRAEKWGAMLLFDEVDIFLAERDKEDLNRTAIVGVFLRLMDYFKGVMFLTSNMSDILDYAILSRVTLRIDYPDLTEKTRKDIWKDKLEHAGIQLVDGYDEIAKINLNGREIRNATRLARVVLGESITQKELKVLVKETSSVLK